MEETKEQPAKVDAYDTCKVQNWIAEENKHLIKEIPKICA